MKILLVGGTGTISTACAEECIRQGMDVYLLVRGTRNHRANPKANILQGDIRSDVSGLLNGHLWDCVIDFNVYDCEDVIRDIQLFKGKTKRFVYISSSSVYQKPTPTVYVNEQTPTGNKYWVYAQKKADCESLFQYYFKEGFPVVTVRPGHCYAEFTLPTGFQGLGFGVVPKIMEGKPILLHGDGTGLWTLTFSQDFASGLVPLLSKEGIEGETYQITSDDLLTWTQIYDMIGESVGRKPRYAYVTSEWISRVDPAMGESILGEKAHSFIFDNTKIKKLVPSFKTNTPFKIGVQLCMDFYRKNHQKIVFNRRVSELMDMMTANQERTFLIK